MNDKSISTVFTTWHDECKDAVLESKSLFIGVFNESGHLVKVNHAMHSLAAQKHSILLINPEIEKLQNSKSSTSFIYEGYVTLGDFNSVNTTLIAKIYRKKGQFLVIGGVDAIQLIEQNKSMHVLNTEINKLQRQLIREKQQLKNAWSQQDKTNQELKDINATKDKFLSLLAHDLRNAFITILGYSEMLTAKLKKEKNDKLGKISQQIQDTSKTTFDLLEKLLEWAMVQEGKVKFTRQQTSLYSVVNDCITLYANMAESKQISISNQIPRNLSVWVDKNMLYTIFRNLMGNAIKYCNKGGKVIVQSIETPLLLEVTVKDNGVGMSSQAIDSLFKIEKTKTVKGTEGEKGTGLGLLLCKEFVEKHGGKIFVESQPGEGSTFTFTLPVNKD